MTDLKVYEVSEQDWWLAESPEKARQEYIELVGDDEYCEEVRQLTDWELGILEYHDDDGVRSFREELDRRRGVEREWVSGMFASTEW